MSKKNDRESGQVENIVRRENSFEDWWYRFGSGIGVIEGDDFESHSKKVALQAYNAGFLHGIEYEQNVKNA